jgi:hypothetical protein
VTEGSHCNFAEAEQTQNKEMKVKLAQLETAQKTKTEATTATLETDNNKVII